MEDGGWRMEDGERRTWDVFGRLDQARCGDLGGFPDVDEMKLVSACGDEVFERLLLDDCALHDGSLAGTHHDARPNTLASRGTGQHGQHRQTPLLRDRPTQRTKEKNDMKEKQNTSQRIGEGRKEGPQRKAKQGKAKQDNEAHDCVLGALCRVDFAC